jgi:SAM-dependent methyltransferase
VSEVKWDPRRVLEYPRIYNAFQKLVGAEKPRRELTERYLDPLEGGRVLEVGCGTGINCKWIPESIHYVGCDLSPQYIDHANAKYGHRGEFHCGSVGDLSLHGFEPFDAILAVAVLHHLTDDQVQNLIADVEALLVPGGIFVTIDPCFTEPQPRLERFIVSKDRGEYVRFPDQYASLLKAGNLSVQSEVTHGGMLIPGAGIIMVGRK